MREDAETVSHSKIGRITARSGDPDPRTSDNRKLASMKDHPTKDKDCRCSKLLGKNGPRGETGEFIESIETPQLLPAIVKSKWVAERLLRAKDSTIS
jgi:hypothetical protein